jgi:hypothetical protein
MKKISLHPILLIVFLLFIIYAIIILVKKIMFDKTKSRMQSVDELNKWNFYFEPYRYHCKQPIKQSFLDGLRLPEDVEIERQVDTLRNRINQIQQSISSNVNIITIRTEIDNLFNDYLRIISELTDMDDISDTLELKLLSFQLSYNSILNTISNNDLIYQLDNLLLITNEIENESSKIYGLIYNLIIYITDVLKRKITQREIPVQQIESSMSVLSLLFNTYNIKLIKRLLNSKLIDVSLLEREIAKLERVATTQKQINFKNELRSAINMYRIYGV